MIDTYAFEIARAADSPRAPSPVTLRDMQQAMWARHRVTAWQGAPVGTLTGETVRRIDRSL